MRINTLMCMGLRVWPPQWTISSQSISEKAVVKDVKLIITTNLLRIDIEHNGIPNLGIISVEKEDLALLYHKLKENIGRPLAEIGDLELDPKLDQRRKGISGQSRASR